MIQQPTVEEKKKALQEINKRYLQSLQTVKMYNEARGIDNAEVEKLEQTIKKMTSK